MLVAIIIWQEISQFISSILNSKFIITILTSWPLAVVIIVMLLRKGILDKLEQLDSFNYKDGTAKFIRDTLNQVKTNQTLSTDNASNQSENDNEPEGFSLDSYSYDPVAAVLLNWRKLEELINEARVMLSSNNRIEQSGGNKKKNFVIVDNINYLAKKGFIDKFTAESLHGLRKVRNEVAHGLKINNDSAIEFVILCSKMINTIKNKLEKDTQ